MTNHKLHAARADTSSAATSPASSRWSRAATRFRFSGPDSFAGLVEAVGRGYGRSAWPDPTNDLLGILLTRR